MPPVLPALSRVAPSAAMLILLAAVPAAESAQQTETTQPAAPITRVRPRQATPEMQGTPAPVVRPRPRPQTGVPTEAPPDAAPLVVHVPRPRPINPQELSGATATTGTSATPAYIRPHTTPGASGAQGATGTRVQGATGVTAGRLAGAPGARGATGTRVSGLPGVAGHSGTQSLPRPLLPRPVTPAVPGSGSSQTNGDLPPAAPKLSATGLNRTVVVLDPGHGGTDSGSRIGDSILEKNVTLALALRLRSLLTARGFTVVLTRDSDTPTQGNAAGTPLTLDDRAGIANHARAAACLLLHATGRGDGLHLYTSDLQPAPGEAAQLPWLTAQAAWIPASQQMERSVSSALGRSHIALVSSTASIRPVDSLTCPAMVMELAPENGDVKTVNDAGYQEKIAEAVAGALVFWQNQVQAPPKLNASPANTHTPHHRAATAGSGSGTRPREAQP